MYSVKNIGNVPAHDVNYEHSFFEVNEKTGESKEIKIEEESGMIKECLFPNSSSIRTINVGKHLFFREDKEDKFIRIRLKITYKGVKSMDPNKYFTTRQFKYKPAKSVEEMNARRPGGALTEICDEGFE